jgi:hypothetical protein
MLNGSNGWRRTASRNPSMTLKRRPICKETLVPLIRWIALLGRKGIKSEVRIFF